MGALDRTCLSGWLWVVAGFALPEMKPITRMKHLPPERNRSRRLSPGCKLWRASAYLAVRTAKSSFPGLVAKPPLRGQRRPGRYPCRLRREGR